MIVRYRQRAAAPDRGKYQYKVFAEHALPIRLVGKG